MIDTLIDELRTHAKSTSTTKEDAEAWESKLNMLQTSIKDHMVAKALDPAQKPTSTGEPPRPSHAFPLLRKYLRKVCGMDRKPGDPFSNPMKPISSTEALATFAAVFLTFLVFGTLDRMILEQTDDKFQLELGSFGALATLVFGLPHAPPSQPRNRAQNSMIKI